jgi:hypothetical protein
MSPRFIAPCLAVLLVCISILAAGDPDKTKANGNPYRNSKVGDFAVYKTGDKGLTPTTKKTVAAKDEKSVKLKITVSAGFKSFESELTIDLTKPYVIPIAHPFIKEGKFAKTGDGTEKIKVAGKQYNANWVTGKYTGKSVGGKEITSEIKVWFSKDAPLDGLLRMKVGLTDADLTTELIESGSAK